MKRQIIIFMHMDDEHPGYIADYLHQKNIAVRVIRAYDGDALPNLDDTIAGLVFMGGIMSVNDGIPWLDQEIELIKFAALERVPLLGHCLGGQMIAKAFGANVTPNPDMEIGWHQCFRMNDLAAEDWLGELADPFIMFHWHKETFSLPKNSRLLFSSDHCVNQAFSIGGNVLGMQCHVEMTEPVLRDWIDHWREDLGEDSQSAQSYGTIARHLKKNIAELRFVADQLYGRWVSTLAL
ncbi:MAG: type 1 glutamine amidotransferase [Cellvibrionales bacterium TMED148]|nr:glutamine amidotransferase [Porticoccaceae bacterium]RPG89020.1 MAG: type 1 glutamine amidotransferase [Cellvibrionales bacterium TMED148]